MIKEKVFLGFKIPFKDFCYIYPPKVNEVVGNDKYSIFQTILTLSQEELEDIYNEKAEKEGLPPPENIPNPYEYLMQNCYFDKDFLNMTVEAFYFFTKEEVTILPEAMLIIKGNLEEVLGKIESTNELVILEEDSYFDFQNTIRESLGEDPIEPPNPNEDPRVKRIKAKARYREKIKAKQGLGISFYSALTSLCCIGTGITPLNIGELSYAAVSVLIERYQEKEKYQTDIDSIIGGADVKKINPKYWIRNLKK